MNKFLKQIKDISLNVKYTKWYINIIENALKRNENKDRKELKTVYGYVEKHHIFPKSFDKKNSNLNNKDNLVFLLPREHFIAHLCLTKMFTSDLKNKMVYAFFILKSKNEYQKERYYSSRLYEFIKRNHFEKNQYVRLYFKEQIKYIHRDKKNDIKELINSGWSLNMTEEYKKGRVGNMRGKKHSEDSKIKISNAHKKIAKPWLKNKSKKQLKNIVKKMLKTKNKNIKNNPDYYKKGIKEGVKKRQQMIKDGLFSFKGENNPRYGAIVDETTKNKIKEKQERHHNNGLTHAELYNQHIKKYLNLGKSYEEISKLLTFVKRTPRKIREICKKYRV